MFSASRCLSKFLRRTRNVVARRSDPLRFRGEDKRPPRGRESPVAAPSAPAQRIAIVEHVTHAQSALRGSFSLSNGLPTDRQMQTHRRSAVRSSSSSSVNSIPFSNSERPDAIASGRFNQAFFIAACGRVNSDFVCQSSRPGSRQRAHQHPLTSSARQFPRLHGVIIAMLVGRRLCLCG